MQSENRRSIFKAIGAAIAGFFTGSLAAQTRVSIGPIRGRVGPYLLGVDSSGNLVGIAASGTVALTTTTPGGPLQLVGAAGTPVQIPTLEQIVSAKAGPAFAFIGPDKKLSAVAITAVNVLNTTEPATIEVTPVP